MVHQMLPHARKMVANPDAQIAQMPGGPDSGTQEMGRRMDRPRTQDDLAGRKFLGPAIANRPHPDGAQSVE